MTLSSAISTPETTRPPSREEQGGHLPAEYKEEGLRIFLKASLLKTQQNIESANDVQRATN